MKYKKSVYRSLAMITQLGLNVMVPTALCVALGVWIDRTFNTAFVIPLLVLGILAGGRNAYVMAMSVIRQDQKEKEEMKKKDGSGVVKKG